MIELRSYILRPDGMGEFCRLCEQKGHLRKRLLPLLGIFKVDTGAVVAENASLNTMVHFYAYKNHEERDRLRGVALQSPEWQQYIADSREYVASQESTIYMPALTSLYEPILPSSSAPDGPTDKNDASVYEFRQTQLIPGYGSVPKLLEAFERGLPQKMEADQDGKMVFLAFSDVGTLNNVIELWKYSSAQACIDARQKSRRVDAWQKTISAIAPGVQSFMTAFLKPLSISPLR